jgi:magnesium transporter
MALVQNLADALMREHPARAVTALEVVEEAETARILARGSAELAGSILCRLSPSRGRSVLEHLAPQRAASALESIPTDDAARLLRRASANARNAILECLEPPRARSLRSMLRFPEGSAGALMDPEVLALPQELRVREALRRVRAAAAHAHYNLYVVDQAQRLVGVLNLRELLDARGSLALSACMVRSPRRIPATADRAAVVEHPGWRDAHMLPVVDDGDAYLGAIRYRTLRALEDELLHRDSPDASSSAALGQLFAIGTGGLIDALAGTASGRGEHGDA